MNQVKKALSERKPTFGSWIQTGSPTAAEILCDAGCAWIGIDCEHSDIDLAKMTEVMRAIYGRGTLPLVRVKTNDTLAIRQALDMGAAGVIVPMVESAEEAKKAVCSALYPPEGVRGFGYCRANGWGRGFDRYAATFNREAIVVAMIETKAGVEHIDEILSVGGIDGVFIGPYDLSGSLGVTGQTEHPLVTEACAKVAAACKRAGKSAGKHIVLPRPERIKEAIMQGYTFLALGADIVFLAEGIETALNHAKQEDGV